MHKPAADGNSAILACTRGSAEGSTPSPYIAAQHGAQVTGHRAQHTTTCRPAATRAGKGHFTRARAAGRVGHRAPTADHRCLYRAGMSGRRVPGGVVHQLPADLRAALVANSAALTAWFDITPLARNEFICWVEDAKQDKTRERRIRRTKEELEEGQRRPCCWPGCSHRERTGR